MRQIFTAAMVIARRDYVATVWSRSFLLFLLGPLIAGAFGGVIGNVGAKADQDALRPTIAVIAPVETGKVLQAAHARLARTDLPALRIAAPRGDGDAQVRRLLGAGANVVITDPFGRPRVYGSPGAIERLKDDAGLILDTARDTAALERVGAKPSAITVETVATSVARTDNHANRHLVARIAQLGLFMLTILLAGMLLSNLVEEKSNKVIEVLAAAVPIDAIFLGKLIAMLSVSLTGIAIWGGVIGGALIASVDPVAIPIPAVGWPMFIMFGALYFVMNYMILGGLFLGIGAQATSVREVQTLSMPVTMAQLAIFAAASAVIGELGSTRGIAAAVFPLTSPLTMLARAAVDTALWPHLLALAWQALWVTLIIRFAAARFRTGVLKSGGPSRRFWRRKATT